jgi:hypothetical protein
MPKPILSKFVYVNIDLERNLLLCSTDLVGFGELVEIHAPDEDTPPQACGRTLQKIEDPNIYVFHKTGDDDEPPPSSQTYLLGQKCILRVVARNRSGVIRRGFANYEKAIVNLEKTKTFKERKIVRAKTGSVRKQKKS